jgi:hypothetical protein
MLGVNGKLLQYIFTPVVKNIGSRSDVLSQFCALLHGIEWK